MAKVRIGIATAFEIENELVGIGTDNPTNTLQALGNIKSSNIKATGVSTLTTYQGFVDSKVNVYNSAGTEQHTTSGEIIIEGEVTVSSGTTHTSGLDNLTLTDSFTLPGISDDEPSVGATRFNENLGSLEFYTGDEWRAVNSRIDMGNSGRGVFGGGSTPSRIKNIDYITIPFQGNAIQFGELTVGRSDCGSCSSEIRGIWTGGFDDSTPTYNDQIDYVTLASAGNAIDFGNLSSPRQPPTSFSSSTRGITAGGYVSSPGSYSNIIDYVEIATIGNATDFGDMTVGRGGPSSVSSPTRGVIGGGISPTMQSNADVLTIASKGNAVRFGELTTGVRFGGASNTTRGIFTEAGAGPNYHGVGYQYITIASDGNAVYFGDMISQLRGAGTADQTRAVFGGGTTPARLNNLEYLTIATTGNATDFGDMSVARADWDGACSDSHGGLGGF